MRKRKMSLDDFTQGFCAAVAIMHYQHDNPVMAEDALRELGVIKISDLQNAGVSKFDLDILRPILKEIKRKDRL